MCGIAGYFLRNNFTDNNSLSTMLKAIAHRGPDGMGQLFADTDNPFSNISILNESAQTLIYTASPQSERYNLALGQCRYAVVDLSPQGSQPFCDDSYALTFNGEIYNYIELREELKALGHLFETQSDTEVFLKAYRQWGTDCFLYLRGPFAGVLLDLKENKLILFRDKVGKNPMYYIEDETGIYWASEIKSLLEIEPQLRTKINRDVLANYLRYGYRDYSEHTFWEGIYAFPPASYCIIPLHGNQPKLVFHKYWNLPSSRLKISDISLTEAVQGFRNRFENAIDIRMRCDVQPAFTLSGGLDSSAIVYSYFSRYSQQIPVYTIRFKNSNSQEAQWARSVVDSLPGNPEHIYVDGDETDLLSHADRYITQMEQPFHSPALFADNYLQRIFKRAGIGVTINGAGGDELLAGYPFEYAGSFLNYLLHSSPLHFLRECAVWMTKKEFSLSNKLFFLASAGGLSGKYIKLPRKDYISGLGIDKSVHVPGNFSEKMVANFTYLKMHYWLNSGNLNYLSIPIEGRAPFLDSNLADFCFTLPPEYLIHNGYTKYILRKAFAAQLPNEVIWCKSKEGFPFPLKAFLQKNRAYFLHLIKSCELEGLMKTALIEDFDGLTNHPSKVNILWRYMCVLMWHKRMVCNLPLNSELKTTAV